MLETYPFFYRPSGLSLQDQWGLSSPETFYSQMKDLVSNLYPPFICTVSGGSLSNNNQASTWQENTMETEHGGQESGCPYCLAFICFSSFRTSHSLLLSVSKTHTHTFLWDWHVARVRPRRHHCFIGTMFRHLLPSCRRPFTQNRLLFYQIFSLCFQAPCQRRAVDMRSDKRIALGQHRASRLPANINHA